MAGKLTYEELEQRNKGLENEVNRLKLAGEVFLESKSFNVSLLDNSPTPILVVNPDTSIKYINPMLERLTGYSLAEIEGSKAPYPWWSDDPRSGIVRDLKQRIANGVKRLEMLFIKKGGEDFWVEINAVPIKQNEELKYAISIWVDITKRKEAEEALRESEGKYQMLSDASFEAIVIHVDGLMYEANDQFFDMFGYRRDELIGKNTASMLIAPESFNDIKRRFADSDLSSYETVGLKKDGTRFPLDVQAREMSFRGCKMRVGIMMDITDRKQAEAALQESEEKYYKLFEHAGFAINLFDAETHERTAFNREAYERLGYSRDEFISLDPSKVDAQKNLKEIIDRHKEVIRKGTDLFERCQKTKNGEIREALISSVAIKIGGRDFIHNITADITDRKQIEKELKKSEAFSVSLLEHSPNPMLVFNADASVRYINPAFERLTGYTSKEIIGKHTPFHWWINDPKSGDVEERMQLISKGVAGLEMLFRNKNEELFWVEIAVTPIRANGNLQYALSTWVNITGRKKAEEALQKAHDELERLVQDRTAELKIKASSLEEMNTALRVLVKKGDDDRAEVEDRVLINVQELVEPYLKKLRQKQLNADQEALVTILESNLNDIVSQFVSKLSKVELNLTHGEIQISNLIKQGKSSKEIGEMLNLSRRTIDSHRDNIRRKLGIKNKKTNLRSYLLSIQ